MKEEVLSEEQLEIYANICYEVLSTGIYNIKGSKMPNITDMLESIYENIMSRSASCYIETKRRLPTMHDYHLKELMKKLTGR